MSEKKNHLQRIVRNFSPFNIYLNCCIHRLALCLPHLMKKIEYVELLLDNNAALLGLWKMFHCSPKKGAILESVQNIYVKKPLKMLKVAVTQWLSHGSASNWILDSFHELTETIDRICLNTAESEARGYRALLINHKVLFCFCFMTDILSIMNTLSLVLQKEGALLDDIQCSVDLTPIFQTSLSRFIR